MAESSHGGVTLWPSGSAEPSPPSLPSGKLDAFPDGVDEATELPGGTWRVSLVMPVDLALTDGVVDPLVLLVALADGAVKVDDKIAELVAHARASGKSWTDIGHALGITKQSAWEKYSGEE
jgi:hypothetical protein